MNGATTEPLAKTKRQPKKIKVSITGISHNFLRAHMNLLISVKNPIRKPF